MPFPSRVHAGAHPDDTPETGVTVVVPEAGTVRVPSRPADPNGSPSRTTRRWPVGAQDGSATSTVDEVMTRRPVPPACWTAIWKCVPLRRDRATFVRSGETATPAIIG